MFYIETDATEIYTHCHTLPLLDPLPISGSARTAARTVAAQQRSIRRDAVRRADVDRQSSRIGACRDRALGAALPRVAGQGGDRAARSASRSDARRVGKECVR